MSFITQLGKVLFGSSIKPNTGDQHTDKVSHQVYEQGVILLSQGNYKEALNHFKKAASFGHISAKYNLALMLFNGLGDYPDFELSRKLFQEAKNTGHTRCDEFLSFMQEIDEIMAMNNPHQSTKRDIFIENTKQAYLNISLYPEMQAGRFIYLISRDILRQLRNNHQLIKDFISNELSAMHFGNDISIQYLKDIGEYQENILWADSMRLARNDNLITEFLDNDIWPSILRFSENNLDRQNLVYARCCIINEIIKKYPSWDFK